MSSGTDTQLTAAPSGLALPDCWWLHKVPDRPGHGFLDQYPTRFAGHVNTFLNGD
jgi:hypothetical protein